MKKIAVIGAGNVGKVLGLALSRQGYALVGTVTRRAETLHAAGELLQCPVYEEPHLASREAEIVFITTPDGIIAEVCQEIADNNGFLPGQVVVHCSGVHSSGILQAAREAGARVLSMHPLQTFPGTEAGLRGLPGTFFAVEGDPEAFPVAEKLVSALGGNVMSIPTEMKTLYHAAACIACNYLATLLDGALRLYQHMDVPGEQAMEALYPLISMTLENIKEVGPEKALTGPIARGDAATIQSHVAELGRSFPGLLPLYRTMGRETVRLALRKGTLDAERAEKIYQYLEGGFAENDGSLFHR